MVAEHLRPQPRSAELSLPMHGCFAASPNSKRVKDNRAGRTEKMQMQATQRSKVYARATIQTFTTSLSLTQSLPNHAAIMQDVFQYHAHIH